MKKDHLAEKLQQFLEESEIDTGIRITEGQKECEWFDSINRGGLTKCNKDFYSHLKMVEIEIKSILLPSITNVPVPDIIERLSKKQHRKLMGFICFKHKLISGLEGTATSSSPHFRRISKVTLLRPH
uniref:Uncharacterized protein n=1 Tax=Amphimedon queenslandica TaxID=400682 RepID=A0A1X7TUP2_AMPQE